METKPSLAAVTRTFFRISNTTFGGGYVTMAALGRELVELKKWITAQDYALAFAVAGVTPGTNIIAFCAATGWQVFGWMGSLAGVFALTAPTAVLAVLILQAFDSGASHPLVMAALGSTVAAVAGMMWSTVLLMVRRHVGKGISQNARVVAITGAAFLASWKFKITPLPILGVATLAGMVWRDRK